MRPGQIQWQRFALAGLDAAMVAAAVAMGYLLRWNFHVRPDYVPQLWALMALAVPLRVGLFALFQLYRGLTRYAGTVELLAILMGTATGSLVLVGLGAGILPLMPPVSWLPRVGAAAARVPLAVLVAEGAMTVLLVGGARFSRRLVLSGLPRRPEGESVRRVVIVGAGDAGADVAKQMLQARGDHCPVGFVDDAPHKRGRTIHGLPVAGTVDELPRVVADTRADEVLVALNGLTPARLREIVKSCEHTRAAIRILPHVADVLAGRVSINQVRPVEIEDLLGREPVKLVLEDERNYVRGRTVLVTGAGGSIGSELCRQLLPLGPEKLVLMGHGENSIYEITQELAALAGGGGSAKEEAGQIPIAAVIGDIREPAKVEALFAAHRPQIVFHAAAHKHVPLMEAHPDEAVKNNVTGTLNVARAAQRHGAEKFILISSDKAVRPTNVMGATKRVAEKIVFCIAGEDAWATNGHEEARNRTKTQFVAVRFGNVLGSRGSVVPLFKRQIARGGPVTLTHPDIERYFMTIPEAVSLVIQAGSMPEQGRLYLLDMGQPVRIADLARNLIRLSGFDPDRDIEVRFTGLRPGEKLKEELLTADEGVKATGMGKIFAAEPEAVDAGELWAKVAELQAKAEALEAEPILEALRGLVPDFGPEKN